MPTAKPSTNGHSSLANHAGLCRAFERVRNGTDKICIGSGLLFPGEMKAGSMAEVMQTVDGIRYLVRGWVPSGMLSMVLAPPGYGKSAFALYGLARPIIVGGLKWFNGKWGPDKPGYVLWCDTEGTAAITVQRIKDWGLPSERIKVPFGDDVLKSVNLADEDHLAQIEAVVNRHKIRLVVIDSLRGAHGGDENSSKVAEVLQSLAAIAERTKAAIVIVHHTRKIHVDEEISADSSRGSNAITSMVRAQLAIDRPDTGNEWCRLQMLKENLGLKPQPVGFRVTSQGLEFGEVPTKPRTESRKASAEEWLLLSMAPAKWYPATQLLADAKRDGYSKSTIERAREALGIVKPNNVKKAGDHSEWRYLPTNKPRTPGGDS